MKTITINRFSDYIKKRYGGRVQKISLDASMTCPNRDGSKGIGGCTYCNNESFAPLHGTQLEIQDQIKESIERISKRYPQVTRYLAYFQAYSNTYEDPKKLRTLYHQALQHPQVIGLNIGTRPDCLGPDILDLLEEFSKITDLTLELGLESFNDQTLLNINRGHDVACFKEALHELGKRKISVCCHLILGLPGDGDYGSWADELGQYPCVDYVKLHQLHVVKGTQMASQYLKKPFDLPSQEQYFEDLILFLEHLSPRIVVQRLFAHSPDHLTLSPQWKRSPGELEQELEKVMMMRQTYQGRLWPKTEL